MEIPTQLRCPAHAERLTAVGAAHLDEARELVCASGCRLPVVGGVPRFVASDDYASSFGRQWKLFRKTQLDSHTGTTISRDRLAHCLGGSLDVLRGKSVLEVGCGAGRFTELMLAAGGHVFACDLSRAVEANYENCKHLPDYFVAQADVRRLPVEPHSFDFVVCIGVIQATPSPEETIAALARQVRPGGTLVIDQYTYATWKHWSRALLRQLLIRLPSNVSMWLVFALARALLPLHRLSRSEKRGRWRLRGPLRRHSPLVDYAEVYPQLGEKLLDEWAVLDTHDLLTDYYKHLRSVEEIRDCLTSCGLSDLEVYYGGNGVEARGRMPLRADAGAKGA